MNKEYELSIIDIPNKEKIEKELSTSVNPHTSQEVMVDVLKFKLLIEEEEKKMKESISSAKTKVSQMKDWVAKQEKAYATATLKYLKEDPEAYTDVEKTWENPETGEVKTYITKERNLPSYISVSEYKKELKYNEELIPEEYFKKEIKKAEVKKAIKDGTLPQDVLTEIKIAESSSHISDKLAFINSFPNKKEIK